MINPRKNPVFLLLLLAAVAGAGIARWCMSSGVGVSPDSVIYLSAADSLIAGDGLKPIAFHYSPKVAGGEPLISFPPVYPLLLSLSSIINSDRLSGARWLHSLLFAANIFLVGLLVYLGTARSALATLVGILLLVSSASMLEIHTMAWSEPPFVLFILLAALLLMLHLATPHYLLLVGASLSASLALTTRYAGVTILPPMLITILLLESKPLRTRIRDCLTVVGIGIFPLVVWLLRNMLLADSATNRSIAFHPLKLSELNNIVNALFVFWVPVTGNAFLKLGFLFLGGGVVLAGILLALKDNLRRKQGEKMNSVMPLFAAAFITTYLLFLFAHNSLIDPAVNLTTRILSPVYVFGIILVICVMHKLSGFVNRTAFWWGFVVVVLALISVNAFFAASFAVHRHDYGSGYASREWARSESIQYIRTLSEARTTYSNGVDAIHFLARKQALRIPAKVDPTSGKDNAEFEWDINSMRNELIQNRAVVVYLDKIRRWYLPAKDELEKVHNLPILIRLNDGVIYGIE